MNDIKRIGILFNDADQADALFKGIRKRHPAAHLTAIVPVRATLPPSAMDPADDLLLVELSPVRLLARGQLFEVTRQLHEQHYDLLILRFGTLKLRILAALVAPARCEIWMVGGTIYSVSSEMGGTLREYFRNRWQGTKSVWRASLSVYLAFIRSKVRR